MYLKGSISSIPPKLHTYQEGYLLPVLTADELLFSARHKGLLRQFRDLAELPQDDFDILYGKLIHNFMEFVQVLPHKTSGILGSLLNYSLARAVVVFQKYCALKKTHTTPLLKFAVFSAALLKDIGKVMSNQRITLTDDEGEYLSEWNPLSGSMMGQTKFYKMYPISATYLKIESAVTPLLARQLISPDAFLWLSSDPALFADWLAALLGEEGSGSREITLALALAKREDLVSVLTALDGALVDSHDASVTAEGEAFYRWLKESIAKGDIAVNKENSGVYMVNEGLLIDKQVFKRFTDTFKIPVNFLIVYTQFGNLMGIAKKSGSDFVHAAYFSPGESAMTTFSAGGHKPRTALEGIVVPADRVFLNSEIPAVSTLKSSQTMAVTSQQIPEKTNPNSRNEFKNTQK